MRMIDALSISVTGWLRESQVSQRACAWGHWRVVGVTGKAGVEGAPGGHRGSPESQVAMLGDYRMEWQ